MKNSLNMKCREFFNVSNEIRFVVISLVVSEISCVKTRCLLSVMSEGGVFLMKSHGACK